MGLNFKGFAFWYNFSIADDLTPVILLPVLTVLLLSNALKLMLIFMLKCSPFKETLLAEVFRRCYVVI